MREKSLACVALLMLLVVPAGMARPENLTPHSRVTVTGRIVQIINAKKDTKRSAPLTRAKLLKMFGYSSVQPTATCFAYNPKKNSLELRDLTKTIVYGTVVKFDVYSNSSSALSSSSYSSYSSYMSELVQQDQLAQLSQWMMQSEAGAQQDSTDPVNLGGYDCKVLNRRFSGYDSSVFFGDPNKASIIAFGRLDHLPTTVKLEIVVGK